MSDTIVRRMIHPEVKTSAGGIATYVASDETLDKDREVIRASGYRFTRFKKYAPFVDSHDYSTIEKLCGKVINFEVDAKGRLIEDVQWAIDVPENRLAQLGWKMTEGGYLKAVSVGIDPIKQATKHDQDRREWQKQLKQLGLTEESGIWRVFVIQEQIELSCCVLAANPNTLARAYKAQLLSDEEIDWISVERTKSGPVNSASDPAEAEFARRQAREEFFGRFDRACKAIKAGKLALKYSRNQNA